MQTIRKIFGVFFTVITRLIAVLFAGLAVFATILALLLSSLQHTLFKAETYQRALREHQVYAQVPVLFLEQLPTIKNWLADPCIEYPLACAIQRASPETRACLKKNLDPVILEDVGSSLRKPTPAETQTAEACLDTFADSNNSRLSSAQATLLKDLNAAQWEALITNLLPPADAQKMTETALDATLAYFKGEVDTARMPLAPLKAHLTGPAGAKLSMLMLKSAPACTKEQQAQIQASDFGRNTAAPPIYCAAEGESLRKLSADLQRHLDQAVAEIPEAATLIQSPSQSGPRPGLNLLGKNPQVVRQRIYTGIRFSPLLVLLLLFLVGLFGVRSLRAWMRWWSIPIFIGALITLGIGVASLPLFGWAWGKYIIPAISPSAGPKLTELGRELARSLVNDLAPWLVIESGLLALLALGLLMGSARVPPPPNRSLPPLAPPGTPGGPVLVQHKSKRKGKRK